MTGNCEDPGGTYGGNASGYWPWRRFHWYDSKAQATEGKINKCDYSKLKFFWSKGSK